MGHPSLQIELVGPVQVTMAGVQLVGWSVKMRALLLYLLWLDQPVERGVLCGLLWPEVPEDKARLSLRVTLTRLRDPLGDRLRADRRVVGFVPRAGDDVDLLALRALRARLATDDGPIHAQELHQVIARLRGQLGEGLDSSAPAAFQTWLTDARAQLDAELRALTVAEDRARDAGTAAPSTPDLEVLRWSLERDPLHEAVLRDYLAALARTGSYDEADAAYRRFTAALVERTGLSPAAATTQLFDQIAAARSRGRRHNLPPADPGSAPSGDLVQLVQWLANAERRLISVVGPAGSGKTALAALAARTVAEHFLDGVLWVAPATGGSAPLLERINLTATELDGPAGAAGGRAGMDAAERLVVLDGLEAQPDDIDALAQLLATGPGLRLLVTATAPLGLVFEHRFPVRLPVHVPVGSA